MTEPGPEPTPSPSGGFSPGSRPPRQGSHPSSQSASKYSPELPYPEELQALLDGKYEVGGLLGQGGMGAVYRGLQLPLRRPVAIKILQVQSDADDFGFAERFKREAYAMASLTHPNIVQVYDCGNAGPHHLFISMELMEGGDLSDAIRAGAVDLKTALKYIRQICDGIHAAHERGIVHRDIKPANIFLTSDGRAKVADFGLAKRFDAKSTMVTKTGLGMGTPDYAAPEQYEPEMGIDHRADIYALGVMIYQMLTGKLPRGIYKAPSDLVPGLDPGFDSIIQGAMQHDREDRYQSVADLRRDLEALLARRPVASGKVPARTGGVPLAASPRSKRSANLPGQAQANAREAALPPPRKGGDTKFLWLGLGGAAVVVAAGAFFARPSAIPSSDTGQSTTMADEPAAVALVTTPPKTQAPTPPSQTVSQPPPTPTPAPAPAASSPIATPAPTMAPEPVAASPTLVSASPMPPAPPAEVLLPEIKLRLANYQKARAQRVGALLAGYQAAVKRIRDEVVRTGVSYFNSAKKP